MGGDFSLFAFRVCDLLSEGRDNVVTIRQCALCILYIHTDANGIRRMFDDFFFFEILSL